MKNKFTRILIIFALCLFAGSTFAKPPVAKGDEPMENESAAKKKRAGEECKTSDDCKRHHRCEKVGDKSICVAPEPRDIPKT